MATVKIVVSNTAEDLAKKINKIVKDKNMNEFRIEHQTTVSYPDGPTFVRPVYFYSAMITYDVPKKIRVTKSTLNN